MATYYPLGRRISIGSVAVAVVILFFSLVIGPTAKVFVRASDVQAPPGHPRDRHDPADHNEGSAENAWKAGTAKVMITPDQSMWMAGFASRTRPSEGKLTELWAKVLALEDPRGELAVLVTLDLVGIDRQLSQAIYDTLQMKHGLRRDQIALCSSHTHSGPVVGRNLAPLHYLQLDRQQIEWIDQYTASLQEKVANLVADALNNRSTCQMCWGSGTATFAVNRRNNRAEQVPELRAAGALKGPYDHDVPVLAVDRPNGTRMAIVFGYACHATALSDYLWSGDYPGFAQIELEAMHPGCVAMFWAGCGGDQNPLPRSTVPLAREYGERLAAAVDRVLKGEMLPIEGTLRTSYREIDLPLDTLPSRDQIQRDAQAPDRYVAARAKMLLAELDAGRPLEQTYPYPIGAWRIGRDVRFILLGGEVVVDYALRLKSELGGTKIWVAGYSNDVMAYIPSRRVLGEGGYEGGGAMVYYGLPTAWAPEVEQQIISAVHGEISATPLRP